MSFKIIFMPQVFDDVQDAVNWYNEKQRGVGKRFFWLLKFILVY